MNKAIDEAFKGLIWIRPRNSISRTQDYVEIGNLELPQDRVNEIRETWETNGLQRAAGELGR